MLLDISPLRVSRDYRVLFFGQLVSFFGSMMTFIIIPWQMYQLTGSNAMVGYIALAEFVPMVVLSFVGGAMADYFDRRLMLRLTEAGQTLLTALLVVNAFLDEPHIWLLFIVVAFHAGLAALQRPAYESYIQAVVRAEMMVAVQALNSIRFNIGMILGPAIGGIIAAKFAAIDAYMIDLATFAASLIAVMLLKYLPRNPNADKPSVRSVITSLKYAVSRQELLGTYFIDIAAMFFSFPQALYPALASNYGNETVGLFPGALAAGALIASLTSGWTRKITRHGVWVIIAAIFWGVGILAFGAADSIYTALLFLAAAGFSDMISGIFRGAIWNQTIPNFMRGRMASIEMISYLTGPMLGSAKMGVVAEYTSVRFALVSGGIACVVAVAATALFLPKFFSYDGRDGIRQREIEEARRSEASRLSESEF